MASRDSRMIEAPRSDEATLPVVSAKPLPTPQLCVKQRYVTEAIADDSLVRPAGVAQVDRRSRLPTDVRQTQNPATFSSQPKCHGVLIVGTGSTARDVRDYLLSLPHTHYDFRGFADSPKQIFRTRSTDVKEISSAQEVIGLALSRFVDEVIYTKRPSSDLEAELIREAATHSINVRFIPGISDTLHAPRGIRYIGDLPTILLHKPSTRTGALLMKRILDVVLSFVGLAVLSPLMFLVAIAVRLDSSGPIFYASPRIGKKGQTIYCYKFRTMVRDAAALLSSVAYLNDRDGIFFKINKDPRITRIGVFLRKYSLDELPQLWNVVRGDMSLVGPRPCIPTDVLHYKTPHYIRHDVLPGLTGLWQVEARNDPSFERYIKLDNQYVDEWSVWLDLKLIARTFRVVLMGTGV